MNLRAHRSSLGISQSKLARLSGVSRFKICTYELGSGSLTVDEQNRIGQALQVEAERIRGIPANIDFGQSQSAAGAASVSRAEVVPGRITSLELVSKEQL
jgi:transcriptional regulator with XRE-family HTH domain